ncbi:MAG: heme-binding beta-barrel domain-containing protein [Mycobacteriales bacterium]
MDLPEQLVPLKFLIGTWVGEGVGDYPTIKGFHYGQRLQFSYYGKPVLAYTAESWSLPEKRPLAREVGFWRVSEAGLEVMLAHPTGIVEVLVGQVTGTRVDLSSDVVARTASAKEVSAERRLYGLVGADLAYAIEMAAVGQPLLPHLSAHLFRVA